LTQNVDNGRSGWNSKETALTPQNVSKLKSVGSIQTVAPCTTQILYYENLNLDGHKNVLFCWTNPDRNDGNATVYAFDADTFAGIWALYVGQQALWATQSAAIDSATNHMYFIYKNDNDNGYNYLIGVDIMTGKFLPNSHKLINATVPGTGDASVGGQVAFQNTDPNKRIHQNCRTSLLIVNSVIYFAFAHNSDSFPYHGWVFAYRYDTSAQQFVQVAYYCTTPNAGEGGVWQGGQGLASDGTSVYFTTGNGDFNPAKNSMSMAVIKMSLQLTLEDYFVPANWKQYSNGDLDLGGCGPTIIPNTKYLFVGMTKYGSVHLVDSSQMGKFTANQDSCRQTISLRTGYVPPGGNPVAWNTGSGTNAKVYVWAPGGDLFQFTFNGGTDKLENTVRWGGDNGGGGLFISSNGMADAILWAYGNGAIYAFDASKDVSAGPIWQAKLSGPPHWGWPLIVNGKIYTNGADSKITVYGL